MAKRFNNLDAALKYLRPTSSGEDGVVPDAPAGTPLKKYQDWKAGKIDIDYPRSASSNPGRIVAVSIKPFALPVASTDEYIVRMSNRAQGQYSLFGLSAAALGIAAVDSNDIVARELKPAKASCRNITGTTPTSVTSKLTGRPYKTKADTGYTFPFGAITAQPSYSDQKAAILGLVTAAGETKAVSFIPEKF
ncbi:MAG: hypothetical protein RMY64_36925 [Nostoc sp. DedQUE08]|uniref:hypothetical protein n=1 Tax=Nostoc sp. DedQUE08 TaxID=3075393 RepID=UPI002AD4407C|nr:hypothetical protein [Nostoc sp. DedQUE08]MDZ8071140.1 hypothetical protein [Nostoc sp. DedQUE08]